MLNHSDNLVLTSSLLTEKSVIVHRMSLFDSFCVFNTGVNIQQLSKLKGQKHLNREECDWSFPGIVVYFCKHKMQSVLILHWPLHPNTLLLHCKQWNFFFHLRPVSDKVLRLPLREKLWKEWCGGSSGCCVTASLTLAREHTAFGTLAEGRKIKSAAATTKLPRFEKCSFHFPF